MKQKLDYNKQWKDYFELDENSPSGLSWIVNKHGRKVEKYTAGSKFFKKNGEALGWLVGLKYKSYLVHRIIWVLIYGSIDPDLVIDHLDGNPLNNSIDNLRLTTLMQNSRNMKKRCDNKTGATGVYFNDAGKGNYYYTVGWINLEGKKKRKHFSINKLGDELAKKLATDYRDQLITELISNGAGYTKRHGI